MADARKLLSAWMTRSKTTQSELALKLGCNKTFVSHLVLGRRRPGLQTAAAIERLCGIPAASWAARPRIAA